MSAEPVWPRSMGSAESGSGMQAGEEMYGMRGFVGTGNKATVSRLKNKKYWQWKSITLGS